jgi:cytochrome P450
MFNVPGVIVADPKIIQEITVNHAYDFIQPLSKMANLAAIVGNGIFFAEGENHKRQRKIMNPAFAYNNIKVMFTLCFINKV